MQKPRVIPPRDDGRIVIHFDYDCFYAAVVENENPALKSVPLIIQQKQILVTCNYEARRRGLHKLQLLTDAKRVCPEAVIVLGEDISRFRNASKDLHNFLRDKIWSGRVERLAFDEIWLDCTDMINYNVELLSRNDLEHSFFCLDKSDPTIGFEYDATIVFGRTYPDDYYQTPRDLCENDKVLELRLVLGSHLARYLRHELEQQKGYTATVGIATNKLVSKLAGDVNKPKNQTTVMPPYGTSGDTDGVITRFMDEHDIGKVPGVGFKTGQKIRTKILGRDPDFEAGLIYGPTKEAVHVKDVRLYPGMGPEMLEDILSGPGSQKGIGGKIWELLNGADDTEVNRVKRVPSQISQEDSYMKYLRTFEDVKDQLLLLSERLIKRMHIDLMENDDEYEGEDDPPRKWLAYPKTLRLSTRPRPPVGPDGIRARTFHRISRSGPLPNLVFSLKEHPSSLAEKLVDETLIPMFRKLHMEKNGWNLSLINIAVTNMAETAAETPDSEGRDIGRMFRKQEDFLKDFQPSSPPLQKHKISEVQAHGQEDSPIDDRNRPTFDEDEADQDWSDADEAEADSVRCTTCEATLPAFALAAHLRFHELPT